MRDALSSPIVHLSFPQVPLPAMSSSDTSRTAHTLRRYQRDEGMDNEKERSWLALWAIRWFKETRSEKMIASEREVNSGEKMKKLITHRRSETSESPIQETWGSMQSNLTLSDQQVHPSRLINHLDLNLSSRLWSFFLRCTVFHNFLQLKQTKEYWQKRIISRV